MQSHACNLWRVCDNGFSDCGGNCDVDMNLLKTLETFKIKESHVNGIMAELNQVLQEGTAEHFIEWHNSKATAASRISPDWYKEYLKECGDGKQ